jgi:uncharacterized protein YfaS (alpha-2-macroglobulin family)
MARTAAGDFVFIDMTRAAFDLSDRGVGGRLPPGATDAFIYTDRGVYRPGEMVHLMALVRNNSGYAEASLPVTLELIRPVGVVAEKRPLTGGKLGGYQIDLPMSPSARTGNWAAYLYVDPKGPAVGSASFQVEEVVPARIELKLKSDQATLTSDATALITVDAQYLYGAPASELQVKGTFSVGGLCAVCEPGDYTSRWRMNPFPLAAAAEDSFTDATGRVDLAVTAAAMPDNAAAAERGR